MTDELFFKPELQAGETEDEQKATLLAQLNQLVSIQLVAAESTLLGRNEPAWNCKVHQPLLDLVCGNPGQISGSFGRIRAEIYISSHFCSLPLLVSPDTMDALRMIPQMSLVEERHSWADRTRHLHIVSQELEVTFDKVIRQRCVIVEIARQGIHVWIIRIESHCLGNTEEASQDLDANQCVDRG